MSGLGIGDVLATTSRIWLRNLHRIVAITVVCYLPLLGWYGLHWMRWSRELLQAYFYAPLARIDPQLVSGTWILAALLGGAAAAGTLAVLRRERFAIGGALRVAARRALPLVGVGFVIRLCTLGVLTGLSYLLLDVETLLRHGDLVTLVWAIAWVVLWSLFLIVPPVVVAEGRGTWSALRRGLGLGGGALFKILVVVAVWYVLVFGAYYLLRVLVVPADADFFPDQSRLVLYGYLALALQLLTTSLGTVLAAVTYERVRAAKEGHHPSELDRIFT